MHVPESCRFGRLRELPAWPSRQVSTLSGCASLSGHQMAATNEGQVEISEIVKTGPVVVFEAGLAGHKEVWNKVFPEIAKTNAVFAYNRPGVGRSTATTRPRDAATMVEDLRALLRKQDLPPPYILVGHSAGGLYLQLFRRYPDEVAGLVLVDPTHPTQFAGEGSMQNRSTLSNVALAVGLTKSAKAEFQALNESGQEVLAAPPPRAGLPIAILTAPDTSGTAIARFDNAKHGLRPSVPGGRASRGGGRTQYSPEQTARSHRGHPRRHGASGYGRGTAGIAGQCPGFCTSGRPGRRPARGGVAAVGAARWNCYDVGSRSGPGGWLVGAGAWTVFPQPVLDIASMGKFVPKKHRSSAPAPRRRTPSLLTASAHVRCTSTTRTWSCSRSSPAGRARSSAAARAAAPPPASTP